jgi:hypothetical protein
VSYPSRKRSPKWFRGTYERAASEFPGAARKREYRTTKRALCAMLVGLGVDATTCIDAGPTALNLVAATRGRGYPRTLAGSFNREDEPSLRIGLGPSRFLRHVYSANVLHAMATP